MTDLVPRFRTPRLRSLAIVAVSVAAACGANLASTAGDQATAEVVTPVATAGPLGDPGPRPAAGSQPAPSAPRPPTLPARPPVPDAVEIKEPALVVRLDAGTDLASVDAAMLVPGVEHVAGTATLEASVHSHEGPEPIEVLAVDPVTFRPLTPEVTAQERGVWERLTEGDAVVRHDVAHRLGLELGGYVVLTGEAGEVRVRVGALASNGAPPFADVLLPWEVARRLGAGDTNLLVVAVEEGTAPGDAAAAIVEQLGGGDAELRQAPEERQASLRGAPMTRQIEPFAYTDMGDGMIVIDPAWVRQWIVGVDLPRVGRAYCHRAMVPQLLAALQEIEAIGLLDQFDPRQFGGCWVPRRIDWSPRKPLSMHAWGLAIDFNTRDNALGATPVMDRRIVAIFEQWGFAWGGWWSRPDGMHFELRRIVQQG